MNPVVSSKPVILIVLATVPWVNAVAEKLPFQQFTTRDGLGGNTVHSIVRDSRGLLWFCTNDGLSRFDGREFLTFGSDNGLGDQEVFHILETSGRDYWVGTARGVSRMSSRVTAPARVSFRNYLPGADRRSQWIQRLLQDHAGRIWIATNGGLYRMIVRTGQEPTFQHIPLAGTAEPDSSPRILTLGEDRFGHVWAGGDRGLYRVYADGQYERYSTTDGLPGNLVLAISTRDGGDLWVGLDGGFCRVRQSRVGRAAVDRVYTTASGLPSGYVTSIMPSTNWVWAGTLKGLARLPVAGSNSLQVVAPASGLLHRAVESLAEDREKNLWIGSMGGGASQLLARGFTTYGVNDGLASDEIAATVETRAGALYAVSTRSNTELALNRFDGNHFIPIHPRLPPGVTQFGWGWAQTVVQDKFGEWWIATSSGVVRYPRMIADKLATATPLGFLRTGFELPSGTVFRVFADSRGDLWISTSGYTENALMRWKRNTGAIQRFRGEDGLPGPAADDRSLASAFAEDASGTIWVGFHRGGLFRFRDGRLRQLRPKGADVLEGVRWIHRDLKDRIWIAGRKGLLRVDEPSSEHPVFRHYGTQNGLATNFVLSITEDQLGRIFVGSTRGVDRLDPDTGHIRRFGRDDGLVGGEIRVAHRDTNGFLWFASAEGISQYDPRQEQPLPAPAIFISQVRLGSYAHDLTATGQERVSVPPLSWRHNAFHVEFMGVGTGLKYEYRLDGLDSDWSEAKDARGVTYSGLRAGGYRFLVRAVNSEGTVSSQLAGVQFQIRPQVWETWWFRSMAAGVVVTALFLLHRMRVAKAVALERIRRRIAQDLHDDLGAGLSHAALLSDLLQREQSIQNVSAQGRLERISTICREAIESMSDIVWAINPEKDKGSDLIQRMRTFGEAIMASRDVQFRFSDDGVSDLVLDPQVRHEMFLVFKEAIHNAVRHSGATVVEVELSATRHNLTLRIIDNGCGISSSVNADGNGLRSMRQRSQACEGYMRIKTPANGGTSLEIIIPSARR